MKKRLFSSYGAIVVATIAAAVITTCEPGDLRAPEAQVDWTAAMGLASIGSSALQRAAPKRKTAASG